MTAFTLPPEDVLRARQKLVLDHFSDEVHAVLGLLKMAGREPDPRLLDTAPPDLSA